jgi:hypothetical protein
MLHHVRPTRSQTIGHLMQQDQHVVDPRHPTFLFSHAPLSLSAWRSGEQLKRWAARAAPPQARQRQQQLQPPADRPRLPAAWAAPLPSLASPPAAGVRVAASTRCPLGGAPCGRGRGRPPPHRACRCPGGARAVVAPQRDPDSASAGRRSPAISSRCASIHC